MGTFNSIHATSSVDEDEDENDSQQERLPTNLFTYLDTHLLIRALTYLRAHPAKIETILVIAIRDTLALVQSSPIRLD